MIFITPVLLLWEMGSKEKVGGVSGDRGGAGISAGLTR